MFSFRHISFNETINIQRETIALKQNIKEITSKMRNYDVI